MTQAEYARSRGVKANAVANYIKNHSAEFEGHIIEVPGSKGKQLDDEAIRLLDRNYAQKTVYMNATDLEQRVSVIEDGVKSLGAYFPDVFEQTIKRAIDEADRRQPLALPDFEKFSESTASSIDDLKNALYSRDKTIHIMNHLNSRLLEIAGKPFGRKKALLDLSSEVQKYLAELLDIKE